MTNPPWLNQSTLRQHVNQRGIAKRSFDSEEEAKVYAARLQEGAGASKRRPYVSYECRMCSRFHVGRRKP